MAIPTEHKTSQGRILDCAQEVGIERLSPASSASCRTSGSTAGKKRAVELPVVIRRNKGMK